MASFAGVELELHNLMDIPKEELSEDQVMLLEAYQKELEQLEADKVDNFSRFIREESAHAKALREESTRLLNRARAIENKVESLKGHYQFVLTQNDKTKVAGNIYTVSLRKNKHLQIDNLDSVPANLKKVVFEPRKQDIKDRLEMGIDVAGCKLVETQSLQIR